MKKTHGRVERGSGHGGGCCCLGHKRCTQAFLVILTLCLVLLTIQIPQFVGPNPSPGMMISSVDVIEEGSLGGLDLVQQQQKNHHHLQKLNGNEQQLPKTPPLLLDKVHDVLQTASSNLHGSLEVRHFAFDFFFWSILRTA